MLRRTKCGFFLLQLAGAAWISSCSIRSGDRVQTGIASWYGPEFHGLQTASGLVFDQNEMTAAHPTLPLGSRVLVTHLKTGRVVEVTVTDRGPFRQGRIIDLSRAAAWALGTEKEGVVEVRVERIDGGAIPPSPVYTLQLGSFRQKENAVGLMERAKGHLSGLQRAEIVTFRVGESVYYRVRAGRFSDRQEAEREAKKLARSGLDVIVLDH